MAAVAAQSPHGQQQYYQPPSPVAVSAQGTARRSTARRSSNGASSQTPASTATAATTPITPATATALGNGPMPPPRSSSQRTQSSTTNTAAPSRDDATRRRGSQQPTHSRSATAIGQLPAGTALPREESTVINRMVVTDPQEDIARAQARQAEGLPSSVAADLTPITGLALVGSEGVDDGGRGGAGAAPAPVPKSRQDHSKSENSTKRSKFGNYILGQTLGEGEFGKVKMGWKRDSSVEVAIKLIRRETLGSNANRLAKIYREIHILRGLDHPNIVRLHEMVETERHIGIILEYASGGELFDYILNHRYLKDGPARKLFSQLISGVGYLHRKGIVHRDLKLENLLLDRNKNIIITDFGFANTFDPNDELSEEIEYRLGDKDYIRSLGLEGSDAARRGDLMQTSCGSPCYAAPELVVSDSLYTGRKVDVWSCGVILYAMLAGYLPFDDDPANPEGDNINLLYKYIVSTPLTFPEYVTPHARDLLKRILVPDPRKRADLFEVARHSWLADYSHVVGFITSSNTNVAEIPQDPVYYKDTFEQQPALARSASVREPGKPHTAAIPAHGGLTAKREQINSPSSEKPKTSRDNKRRTVQVEYVAPQSKTTRGEVSPPPPPPETTPRARGKEADVPPTGSFQATPNVQPRHATTPATVSVQQRPVREPQRSTSDYTGFGNIPIPATRPSTGGALAPSRLPSRGNSYGQPSIATVAPTNAEGRFSQPKGKQYSISPPFQPEASIPGEPSIGLPSTHRGHSIQVVPSGAGAGAKSHKRSNTVTETLGRMTSMFSGRQQSYTDSFASQNSFANYSEEKKEKRYPPTSMAGPMPNDSGSSYPRQSIDSSRRTSFGFSRKNTGSAGEPSSGKPPRRFSLLPSSLSKTFSSQRDSLTAQGPYERRGSNATRPRAGSRPSMAVGRSQDSRSPSRSTTGSNMPGYYDGQHDGNNRVRNAPTSAPAPGPLSAPPTHTRFNQHSVPTAPLGDEKFPNPRDPHPSTNKPYRHPTQDSEDFLPAQGQPQQQQQQQQQQPPRNPYPQGMGGAAPASASADEFCSLSQQQSRKGVLQKSRKFTDEYEQHGHGGRAGSSGSSKKVMDFFRRMGRSREAGR